MNNVVAESYLKALGINITRESTPTVNFLQYIYDKQQQSFPFCTVHIFNGEPLATSPEAVLKSFTVENRGGVCAEQCCMLLEVLVYLGFQASIYAGEVAHHGEFSFPLSHRAVFVDIENITYLLDPGFPFKPVDLIKLEPGIEQHQRDGHIFMVTQIRCDEYDTWVLNRMNEDGNFEPLHRMHVYKHSDDELNSCLQVLYNPCHAFQKGCLISLNRSDFSLITLACGSWAGSSVPLEYAKYVVRPALLHKEIIELIPLESDRIAAIISEEFKLDVHFPSVKLLSDRMTG